MDLEHNENEELEVTPAEPEAAPEVELCKYTGPLDVIQTWFGCGNEWVEQDGKLVPVHQTAEYKEALQWMRKIYEW